MHTHTTPSSVEQALVASSGNGLAASLFASHAQQTLAQRAKRPVSISAQFKGQVGALTKTLSAARPHYVRCLKPNDDKKPGERRTVCSARL